jgi:hypothetical protein
MWLQPRNSKMMPYTSKLLDFLASGVNQSAAAAACGISPALVSQQLQDQSFQEALALRRASALASGLAFDKRLETVEDMILARVEQTAPMITDPMKAVKALTMLSTVKRRNAGLQQSEVPSTVITLDMPEAARVTISLSQDKQVIAIDGRSTATLPSRNLNAMLAERKKTTQAIEVSTKIPVDLL